MPKPFPHYKQFDSKDCGATTLKIIAKHFGKGIHIQELRELTETTRLGSTLQGLTNAAETIGLHSFPA